MPRTIKKYANRRLYDTTASQHVTLHDIRELVAQGEDIAVVDDTSGEDITRNVLLQILAEQEQGGQPILSTQMLMQIIRFYGNPMQGLMTQFLDQSLASFTQQQQQWQQQFQDAMSRTPMGVMQSMTDRNIEAWSDFQKQMLDALMAGSKKKQD
ncbi:MAG: polyhydroxyalkanoate synthesis repressor PhaR [Chromatiales bacterium]|nr:MAG: polyhydroxyalkanoate synthesis repressor PhaR [Chromatiales bacterium]